MALPPDERCDRAKVNQAVHDGLRVGPLRPAGTEDLYGVPKAREDRHWDRRKLAKGPMRRAEEFPKSKFSLTCDLNYTAFQGDPLSLACAFRASVD
jgi:hypothetical protein